MTNFRKFQITSYSFAECVYGLEKFSHIIDKKTFMTKQSIQTKLI